MYLRYIFLWSTLFGSSKKMIGIKFSTVLTLATPILKLSIEAGGEN